MSAKLKSQKRVQPPSKEVNWIIWAVFLSILLVTPSLAFDPINLPKTFPIIVGAGFAVTALFRYPQVGFREPRTLVVTSGYFFCLILLFGLFTGGGAASQRLYGAFGRNGGFLTLMSLMIICLAIVLLAGLRDAERLIKFVFVAGLFNVIYGLLQWANLDPVPWSITYNQYLGTLGNPNFFSAFLGIFSSMLIGFLFFGKTDPYRALIGIALIGVSFFLTIKSESWQGSAIILVSLALSLLIKTMFRLQQIVLKYLLGLGLLFMGIVAFVGMLGIGPLGDFLFKRTLQIRIKYWEIAYNMILDYPIGGIGIENFGENFYRYRTQSTRDFIGEGVFTNSPHNFILELGVNSGIFLLISYVLIQCITLYTFMKWLIANGKQLDYRIMSIFLGWLGIQLQSLISPFQAGVMGLGFALTGMLLALTTRSSVTQIDSVPKTESTGFMLGRQIAALLALIVAIVPLAKDFQFRSLLEKGDLRALMSNVSRFPQNAEHMRFIAVLADQQGYKSEAVEIVLMATSIFPENYQLWQLQSVLSETSENDRSVAIIRLKELNPLYAE